MILLFVPGLLAYLPSFQVPFHFDDLESIVNNSYIRITRLTPSALYWAAFQDFRQNRPLTNLSFALNYYFNIVNPFGYHVVNFALLVVSAFCIFFILERVFTRIAKDRGLSRLLAFLTSFLWLLHPVNIQSVTYIVQRHSAMAGCFSLLSLLCYDLGRSGKRTVFYALAAMSGICALLSKETAFVLPAFIFLYDLWFFQELKPGWLNRNWKWFAAIACLYAGLAAVALRGAISGRFSSDFSGYNFTGWERSLSQGRVLLYYLTLLVYPGGSRLTLEHQLDVSKSIIHPLDTVPAFLIILLLIGAALARSRKYPLASFGVLWYFGQLAMEAMPLPIDLANEHRLYLASIPVIALLPWFATVRLKNWHTGAAFCIVIAAMFGAITWSRNQVWLTPVKLWHDAVLKAPDLNRPWNNYCSFLIEQGEIYRAGYACSYAIKLDPKAAESHSNMGICLFKIGNYPAAEDELKKALEIDPKYSIAYFNLGLVRAAQKDLPGAQKYWEKALELKPRDPKVYYNLALIYEKINDPLDEMRMLKTAISLRPEYVEARLKAVQKMIELGLCDDAINMVNLSPVRDLRLEHAIQQCR